MRQRAPIQCMPPLSSRHTERAIGSFRHPSPPRTHKLRECCWDLRWSFFLFFPFPSILLRYATVMQRYADLAFGDSAGRSISGQQLCSRSYGNITYVGAHNSYAVGVGNRKFRNSILLLRLLDYVMQYSQTRTMTVSDEISFPDPLSLAP